MSRNAPRHIPAVTNRRRRMSHGGYAAVRRRRGATSRIAGTAAHSATERSDVAERFGISDVCRSVAEANMGEGFCIKAVTRYAVLYDVCFSFCLAIARPLFCNEQILFLSWHRGKIGWG